MKKHRKPDGGRPVPVVDDLKKSRSTGNLPISTATNRFLSTTQDRYPTNLPWPLERISFGVAAKKQNPSRGYPDCVYVIRILLENVQLLQRFLWLSPIVVCVCFVIRRTIYHLWGTQFCRYFLHCLREGISPQRISYRYLTLFIFNIIFPSGKGLTFQPTRKRLAG